MRFALKINSRQYESIHVRRCTNRDFKKYKLIRRSAAAAAEATAAAAAAAASALTEWRTD